MTVTEERAMGALVEEDLIEAQEAFKAASMTDREYLRWRLNAGLKGRHLIPALEAWEHRREKFGGR